MKRKQPARLPGTGRACYLSLRDFVSKSSGPGSRRQKQAFRETTLFEAEAGAAGARIVPPQLFFQLFIAMDDPHAALDLRFGGESMTPLAHVIEKNGCSSNCRLKSCRMTHLLLVKVLPLRAFRQEKVRKNFLRAWRNQRLFYTSRRPVALHLPRRFCRFLGAALR